VIANADIKYNEQGKVIVSNDKGNMTLNTKEFEYIEIKDKDERRSYDYGGGASFGKGDGKSSAIPADAKSVSVTLKNQGSEKEQINRATLGAGNINISGSVTNNGVVIAGSDPQSIAGLNRDVTKSQEITKDIVTNQLDGEVTVDVKFWGSVYDVIKTGDINQLSVVKDTKQIAAGSKEAFDLMKENIGKALDALGITGSEADKFLKLISKDINKLTKKEKEFIESILEESKRRYLENALETGDYETLVREEQDKTRDSKEARDGINNAIMDSNIEAYPENKVVKEPINEEYFREKQEEFKNAGQPFCNVYTGEYLSSLGIYIPHDYANNLYNYMANSNDWIDIGLDHVTAQQYAASGMIVIGTYKDKDTPPGGQKWGDGTDPGHIFVVTGEDLVYDKQYYKTLVPRVRSYVKEKGVGIIKTTPLQEQVKADKQETTTYRVYIGGVCNVEK
jgi:hypothetical protein